MRAPFDSRDARAAILRPMAIAVALPIAWTTSTARADDAPTPARASDAPAAASPLAPRAHGTYAQLLATAFVGDALRFNNPYRLATPLGKDAESVARTATYAEVGIAATFGDPLGWQHGAALRMSVAVEGIAQQVVTPSYLLWRRWPSFAAYGRAGVPIVASPDVDAGLEGAAGAVWFVRGGIGIAGEVVGDLFYGAGTREVARPAYPILGAQLGLVVGYEVLP